MDFSDSKNRNKLLGLLFTGVLMAALDIAIVGPALPAIQKQFGIDERAAAWIFSIYVLFNLVGTPLMAKLADTIGRRSIYIIDIALFAAGSLIVAMSPNFSILLLGRAIQGFGSGGIFPVASAVIGDTFPQEKRGSALGLIGAVFGIAFIIGPIIAGVLLMFSWHWLFIINLPIAFFIIAGSTKLLNNSNKETKGKFDLRGMLLLGIILASITYGFNQIDTKEFFQSLISLSVLPFILVPVILLPLFKSTEEKAGSPVLRIKLFASKQVILVSLLSIGAGIVEAAIVFVPPLLVATFKVTSSTASFMLFPVVLAMAAGSPTAGRMLDKMGSRAVLITGTILLSIGMFALALNSGSLILFYTAASISGIGMGFLLGAPLRYIMLKEARASERASGQGVLTLFTGTGQLFGSALVGAVASSQGGGSTGLQIAYGMVGAILFLLIIVSFNLKSRTEELNTVQESI
ncbi:MAG: MFS transporter [Ignavibacteriaceae bacterium]